MGLHIHIHNYNHADKETAQALALIISKLNKIMANDEQFKAALQRIDDATTKGAQAATAIQNRITSLEDAIKNSGLDKETEDKLLAQTEGLAGNAEQLSVALTSMGKSTTDPVPNEPPAPVDNGTGDTGTTDTTDAGKDVTLADNVKKDGE